jgi:hypothetical protein
VVPVAVLPVAVLPVAVVPALVLSVAMAPVVVLHVRRPFGPRRTSSRLVAPHCQQRVFDHRDDVRFWRNP